MRIPLIPALVLMLAAAPAGAVEDYDTCIAMIASEPDRALREAGEWARFGGGAPARHCYALSLIEIGAHLNAADELIDIASQEPDLTDEARADILVQAGELLADRGETLTAGLVAEQALKLTPQGAGALGLRAAVFLAEDRPRRALGDLDRALAARPGTVRLLIRRASAYRQIGNAVAAQDDASFAVEKAPSDAAAWLEKGRAEAALQFKPGARQSFLRAIELDRDGKIGRAAQLALQRMEAGVTD